MNLHKRIRAVVLAARIEYHWWFILHYRKRGKNLLDWGEPLDSKRLFRLNDRLDFHGLRAKKYEKSYETLSILP